MVERQLQQLVDVLAERLGRSVVLDDPEINLLFASRHYGDADDQRVRAVLQRDVGTAAIGHILSQGVTRWIEPNFIPPREDLGMKSRLCHAIRWQGQLLGLLLVIDADQSMTREEIDDVVRAGHEIGALLVGERLVQDERGREQERAVLDLVSADPAARRAALAALEGHGVLQKGAHVSVTNLCLAERTESLETMEAVLALRIATRSVAHSRPGYALAAAGDGRGVLLQTWDHRPTAEKLRAQATQLSEAAAGVIGGGPVALVGIGRVRSGLDEAHVAYGEAEVALRAAHRLPSLRGLALAEELGPLDVVLRVPDADLNLALVPDELLRLREGDPHGRLLETLRTYLDHAGSVPATADALHVHRTSLYYRLERIEQLAGLSLADGRHRLLLHLGLHVLDVVG